MSGFPVVFSVGAQGAPPPPTQEPSRGVDDICVQLLCLGSAPSTPAGALDFLPASFLPLLK